MNVRRCLRQIVRPSGRRRAPRLVEETVTLAELMRPNEVNDIAWCSAEQQERLHAFHPDNSRTCWTCRTHTAAVRRG
ncbi:hypothetical protein G3M58_36900 [Streptomyces sp. SID7499]|uniref:Uncharacterized protein n=1 Tax=Streptomyces sp. SID7499 TaxID=2706086 RepID=A0A6G3X2Y1_9ACTN|nr:hypothetical protein [Streptomyces sp. SID7499]